MLFGSDDRQALARIGPGRKSRDGGMKSPRGGYFGIHPKKHLAKNKADIPWDIGHLETR
jgi:hypothetical protein